MSSRDNSISTMRLSTMSQTSAKIWSSNVWSRTSKKELPHKRLCSINGSPAGLMAGSRVVRLAMEFQVLSCRVWMRSYRQSSKMPRCNTWAKKCSPITSRACRPNSSVWIRQRLVTLTATLSGSASRRQIWRSATSKCRLWLMSLIRTKPAKSTTKNSLNLAT